MIGAVSHSREATPCFEGVRHHLDLALDRFVPECQAFAMHAWDRFKARWLGESDDTVRLTELLENPKEADIDEVIPILFRSTPYSREGHLLKQLCKELDKDQLIEKSFEYAFEHQSDQFDILSNVLKIEPDNPKIVEELSIGLNDPPPIEPKSVGSEIRKTLAVVINFFPRFMDTVLKAFNLIEVGNGPQSIWDFDAMLNIYFKIFLIPHGILTLLSAVIAAPIYLYLITAGIVVLSVVGICLYLKYRPCPTHIPMCENKTAEAAAGKLGRVVGREEEIQRIISYLGSPEIDAQPWVLPTGLSGVGKTKLVVDGVAKKYTKKTIHWINAPHLTTNNYRPINEKLEQIFADVVNHENEVVFFLDELGKVFESHPDKIAGILEKYSGKIQIIGAATREEYNKYIKPHKSIARRFTTIDIEPTSPEVTLKILEERMKNVGRDLYFEEKVAQVILDVTQGQIQPGAAVKRLDTAISAVSAFDCDSYEPKELREMKKALFEARELFKKEGNAHISTIEKLKSDCETLAHENHTLMQQAKKTKYLIERYRHFDRLHDHLAKHGDPNSSANHLIFLHQHLKPWMEKTIEAQLAQFPDNIPLQVNKLLIRTIEESLKLPDEKH